MGGFDVLGGGSIAGIRFTSVMEGVVDRAFGRGEEEGIGIGVVVAVMTVKEGTRGA